MIKSGIKVPHARARGGWHNVTKSLDINDGVDHVSRERAIRNGKNSFNDCDAIVQSLCGNLADKLIKKCIQHHGSYFFLQTHTRMVQPHKSRAAHCWVRVICICITKKCWSNSTLEILFINVWERFYCCRCGDGIERLFVEEASVCWAVTERKQHNSANVGWNYSRGKLVSFALSGKKIYIVTV